MGHNDPNDRRGAKVKHVLNPEMMSDGCIILKGLSECHKETLKADLPAAFYSVQQSVSGAAVTVPAQKRSLARLTRLVF